jgi:aspartate ammonia-lyase
VTEAADYLRDLGIGGSAVGTGVTVEKEYPALMNRHLQEITGLELRVGEDRIQLMQSMGDARPSAPRCAGSRSTSRRSRATCA